MLSLITREELERHVDWAYSLAMDLTRSGYPTYADGIKTREEFLCAAEQGIKRENEEILLFRVDGEVCGWIQWYWLPEDSYAATYSFLTASHTDRALAEFAIHAASKCPGYALHMGFPADNTDAVAWLAEHHFRLLEQSVNHTMFFHQYAPREAADGVACMDGLEDEAAFRALHVDTDLYWTAERILAQREGWRVYLYRVDGQATAALYAHMPAGGWAEIFGLCGSVTPNAYRALMTACLNDCKAAGFPHLTYFEEDEQLLPILPELGFKVVSRYVCYQTIL